MTFLNRSCARECRWGKGGKGQRESQAQQGCRKETDKGSTRHERRSR